MPGEYRGRASGPGFVGPGSNRPSIVGNRGGRDSHVYGADRHSRMHSGVGPGARDIEFDYVIWQNQHEYPAWWTRRRLMLEFYKLSEDSYWNAYICLMSLASIIWVAVGFDHTAFKVLDIMYNVSYAVHVFGIAYNLLTHMEAITGTFCKSVGFLIDMATFSHFVSNDNGLKLLCYYLRLHRPFSYLWALNDYNLKGSVLGTTLKFCYIFLVMRVTWAIIWLNIDALEQTFHKTKFWRRAMDDLQSQSKTDVETGEQSAMEFLSAVYLVNKMFMPIGPSIPPANDIERVTCLLIMLSGSLVVTASAVASLTLVVSLYLRPEESFRARYKLIMKEMKVSRIPPSMREKVETFYKMYWHKQRAVSETQLMPTFPPTLPATILTDIYFEASQKSLAIRDLSYQFLSELAKKMETIHYIPGDAIIKRQSKKSSIIYITYGDIEMVTAEDDSTAILRMTRGTVLTQCGVCAPAGLGTAHLEVRAASFCTAHVLSAKNFWKIVMKHGKLDDVTALSLGSYNNHMERVKMHYQGKIPEQVKFKSSILHFKRSLMALKEAKDANGQLLLARTDVFLEIAKCYIMRNRTDAALTDEADAICLRPTFPCILQPNSSLQDAWHSFAACVIMAVCFIHPYYLVYTKEVPVRFRLFDYIVTAIYILDLIVHLSTGANVEEGVAITFTQTSSQQMRSPWFVLDVVGTLPIFEFIGDGHFAGINKILRLPKIFRVLKKHEDSIVYHTNIFRLLSYTLMLLIACYLIAAFQQGFMCHQFGYCLVTNLTHSPYWEHEPLDDATENRVAFALYWAMLMITYTCHMETWGTENWNTVLYTLLMLEICIILRVFMEAAYSATILVTTALREDYDACILIVKNFLSRNQVDPVLSQRFISYLQLCWYTDKAYYMTNRKSIFYDLPPHVYQDIVAKQRSKYILSIPIMKFVGKEDLKNISITAKLFYTSPNEIIMNTGDMSNEMYVIKEGICEILSPDTHQVVGLLTSKCHFGVIVCLMRIPAYYTIRAVTNVHLFSISRKHLNCVIAAPQIRDAINFIKNQPYNCLKDRREAFVSYKVPEPIPNLQRFRLPRKHEQDIAFLHPFYRLGFLSILRYIFPRFTIRPDGKYIMRYEWFRASCAFASAMLFPSYSYLSVQWDWLIYIATLLDLSAYFDIFQRMLVGYYDKDGILVSHPASTAAHYLKGAFLVDLMGCLPMESLETLQLENGNMYRVTKVKQFLMLNRLLQLYRLPSAMHIFRSFIDRRDILTVFKAIPILIVQLNVMTCFMILYSATIYDIVDAEWVIIPFKDEGGSWLELFHDKFRFNITESPMNLHLATYFWVVYEITSTGYNTLKPSNVPLMRIMFLGMLFGAMLITYFSVRIISIRANVNKALAEFQEHMKDMVYYMRREKLNPKLQKIVLEYYEYNWDKMGGVDYRNMFKLCDLITLRTDAILHIYGPTFAKCPILSHCDVSVLRIVGRAVHSGYFLRGMNIIEANDVTSDMYFVDYGGVDATETDDDLATKLPRGSVFGNLAGLPTVRCPITFTATSRVHLLMIKSQTFHSIIRDFPLLNVPIKKLLMNQNNSYILGNAAIDFQASQHNSSVSPMIVTKRQSLIKFLYFNDKYIQLYLIIVCLLCVYLDVYNAGFQNNSLTLLIILYVLDVCFFMKMLMQFILPLIVDSANVRKILLPMRKTYFQGEFRCDLISCIPIELLSLMSHKHLWFWFPMLRLNRMFRIVTVYNCLKRHNERITINLVLSTTIAAIIWFTLFVHTTSCLWYFIGRMEDEYEPKTSWIWKDDGTSWCDNEYICSLYFVLTTFIQNGVGDIMPKNESEIIFVIILAIISTMIYMILVGEFSNIIQYRSFRSLSFYSKYMELQEFLKNNRVSKNLTTLVNLYSLHLWRESRGMQAPHMLLTAPTALRLQIMSAAYLHHLTRHHIFEECEPAFLRQLVGCLQLLTYNEDMYVVKSSEITDAMYLIHTGKIEEIADASYKVPRIYPAGSYFGVLQGMTHDLPYTHSYRTLIKSQVLILRLDDWLHLLKHYPDTRDVINQHLKYDDANRDGSGGRDNDWSSKKPKPRPPPPPPPTLITELVDKSTPPTPPRDLPLHNGDGKVKQKTSKFIPPMGPQLSKDDLKTVKIQPELWPTKTRSNSKKDSYQESTSVRKQSEGKTNTQKSSISQLLPTKDGIATEMTSKDKEGIPYISSEELNEKDTLLKIKQQKAISIKDTADVIQLSSQQYVLDDINIKSVDANEKDVEETEQLMVTVGVEDEKTIEETEQLMGSIVDDDIKDDDEAEKLMVAVDITLSKTLQSDTQTKNVPYLNILSQSIENVLSDKNIGISPKSTVLPHTKTTTKDIDVSDTSLTRRATATNIVTHFTKNVDESDSIALLITDTKNSSNLVIDIEQSDTSIVLPVTDKNVLPHSIQANDVSDTGLNRRATATTIPIPTSLPKDFDESESSIFISVTDLKTLYSNKDVVQPRTNLRHSAAKLTSLYTMDISDTTIVRTVEEPDILHNATHSISQLSYMKTDQETELKTGPVKILKEGKVEKFDKRLREIDDEYLVSTSSHSKRDVRTSEEVKDEATTTSKHLRFIRVRYEEDNKKNKKRSGNEAPDQVSPPEPQLRILEFNDDDAIAIVGSNSSVTENNKIISTESFKRKKFQY